MRLYDNTRISDARRCFRYFFFRHRRHWKPVGVSKPLAFGGAWHDSMDTLWTAIHADMSYDMVIEAALETWRTSWMSYGMPDPNEMDTDMLKEFAPRTPMVAHEMLIAYYDKRHRQIREMEILGIERPFAVPLTPDDPTLFYTGRIDKIVSPDSRSVRGIEHKTTTASKLQDGYPKIRPMYTETFSPNSQVDGYLYALHLLYPEKHIDVWVDSSLVSTRGEDFKIIPVDRDLSHLDQWLWTTHHWIEQIEKEDKQLAECAPSDRYMAAFPQNTNSCFDFNTQCPFLGLCKSRANPLTWDEAPQGFVEEPWDPIAHIGSPVELT